jgi:hypothetical protein
LRERKQAVGEKLAESGAKLPESAYIFSHDPVGARPWNPDSTTRMVSEIAESVGVKLNVKALRQADMGVLVMMAEPTKGVLDAATTARQLMRRCEPC